MKKIVIKTVNENVHWTCFNHHARVYLNHCFQELDLFHVSVNHFDHA